MSSKNKSCPIIRVGKKGINQELLKEISAQLDCHPILKVKVLKSALSNTNFDDLLHKISSISTLKVLNVRGHTFYLYKPK
jgi:RNA-binding protein YhbY